MKKLIFASLGLNLFLAGMVVAPYLGTPQGHPMRPPMDMGGPRGPMPFIGRVMEELPQDEAAKLRAIFDEERAASGQRREHMHDVMKRVGDVLRQDKPDLQALGAILAEVQATGAKMHEGMARSLERVATELSVDSRRRLVDAFEKGRPPEMDGPPPER